MLKELLILPAGQPIITYTDSQSAIQLATQIAPTKRRKFIDLRFYYVMDGIEQGLIKLDYLPTDEMIADIFTKPISTKAYNHLSAKLRLTPLITSPSNQSTSTASVPLAPWRQGGCQDA